MHSTNTMLYCLPEQQLRSKSLVSFGILACGTISLISLLTAAVECVRAHY